MANSNEVKASVVLSELLSRSVENHFEKRIDLSSRSRCRTRAPELEFTFAPNVEVASDTLISIVPYLTRNVRRSIHEGRLNIRFSG